MKELYVYALETSISKIEEIKIEIVQILNDPCGETAFHRFNLVPFCKWP